MTAWRHGSTVYVIDVTQSDADVIQVMTSLTSHTRLTSRGHVQTLDVTDLDVTEARSTSLTSRRVTPTSCTSCRHWRHAEWRRRHWRRIRDQSNPLESRWRTVLASPTRCRPVQRHLPRSTTQNDFLARERPVSLYTTDSDIRFKHSLDHYFARVKSFSFTIAQRVPTGSIKIEPLML